MQNIRVSSHKEEDYMAKEDVSKKTLVVLVFLVILVTIFGTWAVLNTGTQTYVHNRDQANARVMLEIAGESPGPGPVEATGNVAFVITG